MKEENEQKKHQFHRAIEAQLHLLDLDGLQDVMKLVTEIICPEPHKAPKARVQIEQPF